MKKNALKQKKEKKASLSKGHYLLLGDVNGLGQQGDVVTGKPGFFRNYLLPKGLACFATPATLLMQEKLKQERVERTERDYRESTEIADRIAGLELHISVRTDADHHMYGSVTRDEVLRLLQGKGFDLERNNIALDHPIKETGVHTVNIHLKEQVSSSIVVHVQPLQDAEKAGHSENN